MCWPRPRKRSTCCRPSCPSTPPSPITCAPRPRKLNEPALLAAGRWEAFTAKPTLARLLDLWDGAGAGADRTALMRRA